MATFTEDGYVLDGYIAAAAPSKSGDRLWEAVEFKYRPSGRIDGIKLDGQVNIALQDKSTNPDSQVKAEKLACEFVQKHLVSWNISNRTGITVPITAQSIGNIHSEIFAGIYSIIRGWKTSDPRPETDETPASDTENLKN